MGPGLRRDDDEGNCAGAGCAPYQGLKSAAYGRSEMPDGNMIEIAEHAKIGKITEEQYFRLYKESIDDPNGFWGREGKRVDWIKPYTKVMNASYDGDVAIKWYEDGTLNAAYNCIDRHLAKRGDQVAILWEGDDPNE